MTKPLEKSNTCIKCFRDFGSITDKGKQLLKGSKGFCKPCYNKYYLKSTLSNCKRCDKELLKKSKGFCSLCKVELESMKSPSKRSLPKIEKIKIEKSDKEIMRRIFNRYKWGMNTLVDPFIVTDLYLTVFSFENTKNQTVSKTEFNLDQFDEESQVIAMLKLLKMAYDIC